MQSWTWRQDNTDIKHGFFHTFTCLSVVTAPPEGREQQHTRCVLPELWGCEIVRFWFWGGDNLGDVQTFPFHHIHRLHLQLWSFSQTFTAVFWGPENKCSWTSGNVFLHESTRPQLNRISGRRVKLLFPKHQCNFKLLLSFICRW